MMVVTLILAAASLALGLARWLRLPAIPLYVLGGIGLSLANLTGEAVMFQDALMLGLTFLMFFAGTELDVQRVGRQRRAALGIGSVQFLVLAGVGVVVGWWLLRETIISAMYLGLALAASSTIIVVNLLRQRQQFFERSGRLILGVLLLQDIFVVAAVGTLSRLDEGWLGISVSIIGVVVLILLAFACAMWVYPRLLRQPELDDETQLLIVLAAMFIFIFIGGLFELPMVIGAFIAGMSLSRFPVSGLIRGQISSLGDFFLAVFFVTLGAALSIPSINELLLALVLAAVVIIITPPLVGWLARRSGMSMRMSIESGLLLAQCSELSLIVAIIGWQQDHMSDSMFRIIAMVTVLTMILAPFVATERVVRWLMRRVASTQSSGDITAMQDHIILLGGGESARLLLRRLRKANRPVVVVEDDLAVARTLQDKFHVATVVGDATEAATLHEAGVERAGVIISTLPRIRLNLQVLEITRDKPTFVRVFTAMDGKRVETFGGIPAVYATAAADAVMQWLDAQPQ